MSRKQSRKSTKTPPPTSKTSTSTPSSPKSSQPPTPKELSLIKLTQRPPSHVPHEHDSTHLKFLNRSLKKNDTELAALSLLNLTLGEYRNVILDRFGEDVLLDLGEGIICLEKEDGYTVIVKDRAVVVDEKGDGGENKDKDTKDTKVEDSKGVKKEMKEEKSTEKENEENNADPPNLEEEEEEDAMDTTDDAGNDTNTTTTTEKDDEKDTKDTDKATADTIQSNDTVSPEKESNEEPTKEPTKSNTDTTTTTKPKHNYTLQDQEIFRQFLLRLKLRRKLLNRLSRRLLRLSHGMDGKINKITPPPPPKYGNSRLIKHEAKEIKSMREELNKREVLDEKRRNLRFQADLEWGKMLREQQEVLKDGLKDVDDADDKDSKNVDDKANVEEKTNTEEEDDKKDGAGDPIKEEAKKDTEAPTSDTTTTTTPEDKNEDTAAESNPTQDSSSATTKPTDEATKEEKEDDQSSSTTPEDKMETDVDTKKEEKDDTVDEKESSTSATTTTKEEEHETTKKEAKDEADDTKTVTNTTTIPPLPPKREIILDPLLLNQEYQQTLQQLAEYDTEYEKNVNPLNSTQTTTYTLTEEQMQEMDYEAEYFDDQSSDDNVKTGIGASVHHMNSREKAQEWQRWQNDVLGRIADHPTFGDLGMEHEVFDLEGRRKRVKLAQEKEEKELKKMKEEEDAQDNDVVEKDDEEEEEEKDKDSDYEEDMKDSTNEDAKEDKTSNDSKEDKDAKQKSTSILPLKRPVISLDPVPSFYEQDYRRTLVVHSDHYSKNKKQETRPVRNSGNAGKPGNLVAEAQSEYDKAWRRSNDVQNRKLRLDNELKNIYYRRQGMMQQYKKDRDVHVAMAKRKWLAQKTDFEKQKKHRKMMEMTSAGQSYGARFHPDALKALSMSDNDLVRRSLYDSVDRVMIRTLPKEYGVGSRHTQVYGVRQQHMAGPSPMDKVRKSVSSALAHCVDVVVKRTETGWVSNNAIDQAFDGDQFPPFKAPRINHPDKMVINDRGENFSQLTSRYKAEVVSCSRNLQECETDRSKLWNKLMKVRMECGVSGPPPSSQQRSQPQQQQQPSRGHSYHQRR